MLKGYGVGNLATELLIVSAIAIFFLVLALSTVKDRIDA